MCIHKSFPFIYFYHETLINSKARNGPKDL